MGLLINQGKHKDEKPIEMEYALMQITALKEAKDKDGKVQEGYMQVELTMLTKGKYQGKKIWDRMPYIADEPTTFKYKQIRRAAKVPYDKNEPDTIDIEALLLNKAVGTKLSIFNHEDGRQFQNVGYVAVKPEDTVIAQEEDANAPELGHTPVAPAPMAPPVVPGEPGSTPPPLVTDDDFPF